LWVVNGAPGYADEFRWFVNDGSAPLGGSFILRLYDPTATAFPNASLPSSLTPGAFAVKDGYFGDQNLQVQSFSAAEASAVPEPANWVMMLGGFGFIGLALRRRRADTRYATPV
jgi:hypothetical protein